MSIRMEPHQRKEFILKIAKELFSNKGYYDTQIQDIVEKAKISRGTIYQYFKNKDDIYLTLLEDFFNKWQNTMKNGINLTEIKSLNPVEFLQIRIKQSLNFFAEDHMMSNIILRNAPGAGKDFANVVKKLEKKIKTLIFEDLKLGIRNNFVKKDLDIDIASELIAGGVLRIAYYYFSNKKNNKKSLSLEELSKKITEFFVSGLFYCKK